ncbi:putative protease Do-like 3 [Cardamine amara subsp. amara]|uniref:Protease Do-like 3 n=1 Tax=Cardamine amara subsp. amara TaxID=228776 RepID=A0ABD1BDW7_CARAN
MSFRSVCIMSRFCIYSSHSAPELILLRCNSSFNFRWFSSKKSETSPLVASKDKINLVVNNFSVSKIFQHWKNKLQQRKKVSAIDLALNSVVKVFTVSSKPRLFQPWQICLQSECTGSGFVFSGRKILTNAHVVADHTSVKVRKHGSPTKYKAKVRAIGHECDLAVLEINSEEFWEGMNPLEFGDIPSLYEEVVVVGYPEGGDNISVTKGVVSRVEPREYSHSATELLAIQIDAAINSGNSGGPVIMGDKVAGVAFESLDDSENIGYIIPTPVIKHFLNGVEKSGQNVSFCSINLTYQNMENAHIRDLFKMSSGMTGILINRINPLSDAHKVLKKNDVILAIDGVPIGNDSTVPFRKDERITFKHLISIKKPYETALLKVLREGQEYEFNISLKPVQQLVPMHRFDKFPSYYIFGGLVFVPLTKPYIDYSNVSERALETMPKKAGEEIVIISQVLEDDITTGYNVFEDFQVKKVNGVQLDNLKHLCQLIEECCTKYLKLDLEKDKVLAIDYKSAKKATSKILKNLKIPSAMSEDLQPKQLNRRRKVLRQSKKH